MMERRQIVKLWRRAKERRAGADVLVTLVRAEGSSYRQPGARLLTVSAPAEHAGTLSGGCLEAEVIRKAEWISRDGAAVERYSMSFDDTAEIPFGLGCGGTVDLLFERADSLEGRAALEAMADSLLGRESTVVSFLPGDGRKLRRVVFNSSGEVVFASEGLSETRISCARLLNPGDEYEGRFVERLGAPQRLFVLGGGDDARPLVAMAAMLGWSVVVADARSHLAQAARFPEAAQVLDLSECSMMGLDIGPRDAVVLMTHSFEQDRELLAYALPLAPRYLGLLGSRHRSSLLVSEAAASLGVTVDACCERIFAPVGMDLGGDGPEAIALAIVAEVQAVCEGKLGNSRRLSARDVAEQIARGGASAYLQAQCALSSS